MAIYKAGDGNIRPASNIPASLVFGFPLLGKDVKEFKAKISENHCGRKL